MKRWQIYLVGLTLLSGCASTPAPPCPCEELAAEADRTSEALANALRDKGILRQQLKACAERR